MERGVFMELEILKEVAEFFGKTERDVELQCELTHPELTFCQAHVDGVIENALYEIKTTKHDPPKALEDVSADHYYQTQWQMWLATTSGFPCTLDLIYCVLTDEKGDIGREYAGNLVNSVIELKADENVWKTFYENSIEFWELWQEAKSCYDEHLENCIDIQRYEQVLAIAQALKDEWKIKEKERKNGGNLPKVRKN
jgi:hypothetical protein